MDQEIELEQPREVATGSAESQAEEKSGETESTAGDTTSQDTGAADHAARTAKDDASINPEAISASNDSSKAGNDNRAHAEATIGIRFVDFRADPISGLKYKLKTADGVVSGTTIADGSIADLITVPPDTKVDVFVFREHSRDYKCVGSLTACAGTTGYTIASPKFKCECSTEPHVGDPGDAEDNKPAVPETPHPEARGEQLAAKPAAPASPRTSPPAKPSSPASNTAAKPASLPVQKHQVVPGRDSRGNPQATVEDSTLDWLKRKILSMFNFWTWADFQKDSPGSGPQAKGAAPKRPSAGTAKPAPARPRLQPTRAHPLVNPPAPAARSPMGQPLPEKDLKLLQGLIAFAEAQVELDYKAKYGSFITLNVVNDYTREANPSFPRKRANDFTGRCLAYVRIALFKAGYGTGAAGCEFAKDSAAEWLKQGFQDVTETLPKVDITYENTYAPGDATTAQDIARKRASIKARKDQLSRQGAKGSQEWAALEEEEKKLPPIPAADQTAIYRQPDLMYTLPGDVIVYRQVHPVEVSMPGHIDIRTYHGFVSDAVWATIPALGVSPKKRYQVIGVYRKISDTMAMARAQAFLRILRELETEGYPDPYRALPRKNGQAVMFDDFRIHPSNRSANEPAGAYQIRWRTWDEVMRLRTGWPAEFAPQAQERFALYLLHRRPMEPMPHPRRSALGYVMEGKIELAITDGRLWNEWACLPGGGDQSRITMEGIRARFDAYLREAPAR